MKYYIEIGTCDFDTFTGEVLSDNQWTGIAVEPIKQYFDNIPKREQTYYENSAIVDDSSKSTVTMYSIQNPDQPWKKGISSLFPNHKDVKIHQMHSSYTPIEVPCLTFKSLLQKYNITQQLDFLKVDTEGFDINIVNQVLNFYNGIDLPKKIMFEHKHSRRIHIDPLLKRLAPFYSITKQKHDFICVLKNTT
jgi:FkbM family methyltransferase